jgi:pimeloyl-ACP methyl ester carboxylesterase
MTDSCKALVHGNPEVGAVWDPLVEALARRGVDDIVTLSPPGFGAPTPEHWTATMAEYVDWLASEVDAIGRPVDLVGHDWGTGHVLGLVARTSRNLRSFAVDVAGLVHPEYRWHEAAQAWQTPGTGEEVIAAMVAAPVADRAGMYEELGLPPDIAAAMADALDEAMGRCILGLYRDAVQPAMVELGRRVAAVDLPRPLVIDATADPYVASELGRDVARTLGAELLTLEGHGHWWMTSAPDEAANGLVAFWSPQ